MHIEIYSLLERASKRILVVSYHYDVKNILYIYQQHIDEFLQMEKTLDIYVCLQQNVGFSANYVRGVEIIGRHVCFVTGK